MTRQSGIHHLDGEAPFSHDLAALITLVGERGGDASQLTALISVELLAVLFHIDDMPEMELPSWPSQLTTIEELLSDLENLVLRPR